MFVRVCVCARAGTQLPSRALGRARLLRAQTGSDNPRSVAAVTQSVFQRQLSALSSPPPDPLRRVIECVCACVGREDLLGYPTNVH